MSCLAMIAVTVKIKHVMESDHVQRKLEFICNFGEITRHLRISVRSQVTETSHPYRIGLPENPGAVGEAVGKCVDVEHKSACMPYVVHGLVNSVSFHQNNILSISVCLSKQTLNDYLNENFDVLEMGWHSETIPGVQTTCRVTLPILRSSQEGQDPRPYFYWIYTRFIELLGWEMNHEVDIKNHVMCYMRPLWNASKDALIPTTKDQTTPKLSTSSEPSKCHHNAFNASFTDLKGMRSRR
ncbi:hypothetical protein Cgig2_012847 [Carnegiea gigantea]|uniref:Uncharacterized protein n=1 Tax=Carnegiea gigantea TaxID=171969 RepID=A0A9Q1K943_9CARY|nr:hypothetical protein Cgig2_012847 [Carnegiea gigantea]